MGRVDKRCSNNGHTHRMCPGLGPAAAGAVGPGSAGKPSVSDGSRSTATALHIAGQISDLSDECFIILDEPFWLGFLSFFLFQEA